MPDHLNFITGNANKLKEVKLFLEPAIEVRSQAIDIEEVQGTIEEVTKSKCRKAAEMVSFYFVLLFFAYRTQTPTGIANPPANAMPCYLGKRPCPR